MCISLSLFIGGTKVAVHSLQLNLVGNVVGELQLSFPVGARYLAAQGINRIFNKPKL